MLVYINKTNDTEIAFFSDVFLIFNASSYSLINKVLQNLPLEDWKLNKTVMKATSNNTTLTYKFDKRFYLRNLQLFLNVTFILFLVYLMDNSELR